MILEISCVRAQGFWEEFGNYWYQGKAELSSYELSQNRYGELHEGHAVLIFVTEPFSKSQQVKLDKVGTSDEVTVMKLNMTKKFLTGIYPYSMMMSSFVPVSYDQYPDAIKVTTTSQEWCGHTFTQLNLMGDEYKVQQFSYFQSEGDIDNNIEKTWLEDEIWQRIRLQPKALPVGDFEILPGTLYLRLAHRPLSPVGVNGQIKSGISGEYSDQPYSAYHLKYPDRSIEIFFTSQFPHRILGWEETYGGFTTVARLKDTILEPYWQLNSNSDRKMREKLGL
jgi:hypothetical protein